MLWHKPGEETFYSTTIDLQKKLKVLWCERKPIKISSEEDNLL